MAHRASAQNPEDRIDEQTVVFGDAALRAVASRQMGVQQGPGCFGNIVAAVDGRRVFHTDLLRGSADSLTSSIS
ncbi:MAG: hypothetical protein OJF50_003182 [Nitrospira sp.]|nr:hypothetical protein [Nitrospira sp.]MDI3464361.1 hypothetical protein [Nitrospira sp.]